MPTLEPWSDSSPGVFLEWMTMTEVNNLGFYIERRADHDSVFSEVLNSFVPGAGTTIEPQYYSFSGGAKR
jgi:hypothetical protein